MSSEAMAENLGQDQGGAAPGGHGEHGSHAAPGFYGVGRSGARRQRPRSGIDRSMA